MLMAELIDVCVEHNISEPEIVDEAEISHDIISNDDEVQCIGEKFAYVNDDDELEVDDEVEMGEEVEVDEELDDDEDLEHDLDWKTILPTEITKPCENDFDHDNG